MAFTFNWAGINAPAIQGGSNNYQQSIRNDAASWGDAARGYKINQANKEYADLLNKQYRMSEIQGRIKQLEQRNAEIRQQIQGMGQTIAEELPGPAFPDNYYGQAGNMEYPLRDMNIKTPMNISGIPVDNAFGY